MVSHYQKLFNPESAEVDVTLSEGWSDIEMEKRLVEAFSLDNIKKCKANLKSGSAPGPDKITYNMLKQTGEAFDEQIHNLFNKMVEEREWPKQLQVSSLKSLFKKGRPDLMVNYR